METRLLVSEAAALISRHPDTLRRYERKGVIQAKRDYRGFRVFMIEDLLKLKRNISKLEEKE